MNEWRTAVAYSIVLADLRARLAGVDAAILTLENMRRGTCLVAVNPQTFVLSGGCVRQHLMDENHRINPDRA